MKQSERQTGLAGCQAKTNKSTRCLDAAVERRCEEGSERPVIAEAPVTRDQATAALKKSEGSASLQHSHLSLRKPFSWFGKPQASALLAKAARS